MNKQAEENIAKAAIRQLRSGKCHICGKPKTEITVLGSAGFGQGLTTKTAFICTTDNCGNKGK